MVPPRYQGGGGPRPSGSDIRDAKSILWRREGRSRPCRSADLARYQGCRNFLIPPRFYSVLATLPAVKKIDMGEGGGGGGGGGIKSTFFWVRGVKGVF